MAHLGGKATYTTCRDMAAKLEAAGVPVTHDPPRGRGPHRWWFPFWAGQIQGLIRDAGIPATKRREVLSKLAADVDKRDALFALVAGGAMDRVRLYLTELAG